MQCQIWILMISGCLAIYANAEQVTLKHLELQKISESESGSDEEAQARPKRTLFLKKKLLGAGLLGFGLGVTKGYKYGYHSGPEVHHVYVAPPPPAVKYIQYIEKPVFVPKIIEKPVFKSVHYDYEPAWSPPEPSPAYGSW